MVQIFLVDNGKLKSRLPIKITNKKARIIILAGRTFNQANNNCKWVSLLTKIKNNKICEIKKVIWKVLWVDFVYLISEGKIKDKGKFQAIMERNKELNQDKELKQIIWGKKNI